MYYCRLCGSKHRETSKLGVKHVMYVGEPDDWFKDGAAMSVENEFKSKKARHALQPEEEIIIMFRMFCMMLEKDIKKKYDKLWRKIE